jgi:hypothetical protein
LFSRRDIHLLSKMNINLVSSCHLCVHLYMAIHFIVTFHILCIHDSHVMHMHCNRCGHVPEPRRGQDGAGSEVAWAEYSDVVGAAMHGDMMAIEVLA